MCLVVSRTYLPLAAVMYVCADPLPNGYSHAAVALGKKLFPMFALALDLNEDFFDDKVLRRHLLRQPHPKLDAMAYDCFCIFQTKHSAAIMKVLHYPPQTGPVDDRVIGIGAHTE